ncbi:MAG: universal stress protein [Candidatus Thermoplasmatota archaeon]|nr:universal stress protein [Candidatus Thermoplasmatota archaeon]MCL5665855.1 universal stress protein [Candidatus Thermoplasmatota archaeon]
MTSKDGNASIKNVLCATDFSQESEKAVDFAAQLLSANSDVTLYLFHAVKIPYVPAGDYTGAGEVLLNDEDALFRESTRKIREKASHIKALGFKKVHGIVKRGEPVHTILEAIEYYKADLVVMGTRKHSFTKGIFFGSVSERVSASTRVSVLIVR